MKHIIDDLIPHLGQGKAAARIVLVRAEGSTPRELGAAMMIYDNHFAGTIGGGTLEHEVILVARKMIAAPLMIGTANGCGGNIRWVQH